MKRKRMFRMTAVFLAMVMCVTTFSVTALASGGEDTAEVTEAWSLTVRKVRPPRRTRKWTPGRMVKQTRKRMISWNRSPPCSVAWGNVSADGDGIRITVDTDGSTQTGTVTTGGGNLNVRTGAGLDNEAFTQLPNGTQVEVTGTEGEWIKVLLPEREGYVHSDYLTVSENGDGGFSLSLDGEELHLTPYEYKLLCLLAHNVGKVLTHSYITREIWGRCLGRRRGFPAGIHGFPAQKD